MLHRGIIYVHVTVLAFSAVLAFLFLRELDESAPLGNSALVDVFDSDESVNATRVARSVERFAAEHHVTVARDVTDLRDPDGVRNLYVASGGAGSRAEAWLRHGYPSFGRDFTTRVRPLERIAHQDPRGPYYVYGSAADADSLQARFASLGLSASVSHPLAYRELADRYQDDPLFRALCVVALAVLTTTGAGVLLSAKKYGVLRLHGMSVSRILLRDLRQLVPFWALSALVVTLGAVTALGFYNQFAWLGLYAAVTAGIAGLLTLLALASHAAALALTFRVDVLRALKGELPSRAASITVYLVRIPALLLALSIATNVALAGRDVSTREENRDAYRTVGDAVTLRINGAFAAHMDQVNKHVGPWLRDADKKGEIIVAGRRDLQLSVHAAHTPPGEILVVNDTYLSKQQVLDPAGHRFDFRAENRRTTADEVRVIVPRSLGAHAPAIARAASNIIDPGHDRQLTVKTLESRTGQNLFGYSTGAYVYNAAHSADEDRSQIRDPVVIAVPNGSRLLTDDAYTAFATQAGVVFSQPGDALRGIEQAKVQDYVNAVSPVGRQTAADLRSAVGDLRLQIFNLVVAVIVLLVAGVGVCLIYARKNAQSIFVKRISGWNYPAIHRAVLLVEVGIAVVFATRVPFVAWKQHQELEKYTAVGAPAPFEPLHITALDAGLLTGLVGLELGALLVALALFHRRIIKNAAAAS